MYIAKSYVLLDDGRMITPGECFDAKLNEEQEKRLVQLGAIKEPVRAKNCGKKIAEENDGEDDEEAFDDEDVEEIEMPEIDVSEAIVTPAKKGGKRK